MCRCEPKFRVIALLAAHSEEWIVISHWHWRWAAVLSGWILAQSNPWSLVEVQRRVGPPR